MVGPFVVSSNKSRPHPLANIIILEKQEGVALVHGQLRVWPKQSDMKLLLKLRKQTGTNKQFSFEVGVLPPNNLETSLYIRTSIQWKNRATYLHKPQQACQLWPPNKTTLLSRCWNVTSKLFLCAMSQSLIQDFNNVAVDTASYPAMRDIAVPWLTQNTLCWSLWHSRILIAFWLHTL